MKIIVPDYYPKFRCTAGNCRHNCCIGWEIDIDPETFDFYKSVVGDFGRRLRDSIDTDGCPHFCLAEHDRCPFLNGDNLCDIYINLGEEHLCSICADHPRYRNYIGGRCEMGLGLSCEAACELILSDRGEHGWIEYGEDCEEAVTDEWETELLGKRSRVIEILTDRAVSFEDRVHRIAGDCFFGRSAGEWREFLSELERMDENWDGMLSLLEDENTQYSVDEFDRVWENLTVYFVNRHTAKAADEWEFDAAVGFALFGYAVIRTICEGIKQKSGSLDFDTIAETARMYSSEIEYSEENTESLIWELGGLI